MNACKKEIMEIVRMTHAHIPTSTERECRCRYEQPALYIDIIAEVNLLAGSERDVPFDPTDGTDDALVNGSDEVWGEDWEQEEDAE